MYRKYTGERTPLTWGLTTTMGQLALPTAERGPLLLGEVGLHGSHSHGLCSSHSRFPDSSCSWESFHMLFDHLNKYQLKPLAHFSIFLYLSLRCPHVDVPYIIWLRALCWLCALQVSSPTRGLICTLLMVFWWTESLHFNTVKFSCLFKLGCVRVCEYWLRSLSDY